jgi:UV DNA damage endonuclease
MHKDPSVISSANGLPKLGLVCITTDDQVRYRTITRKRLLQFSEAEQQEILGDLYRHNISRLQDALRFCILHHIRLYRFPTNLFPFVDTPIGASVLGDYATDLLQVGTAATEQGIRLVVHPEQFIVLSSESQQVVANSRLILESQAWLMDLLQQPRSPWALIEIHGGKRGRSRELAEVISKLPDAVRTRLGLENDEYAYSAEEILAICQTTGIPMIFDAHHHVLKEGLVSYNHPSIEEMVHAARLTWPDPAWQIVHLSNGRDTFGDRSHSDLITQMPAAYATVPWIEVEAKKKEVAITQMRHEWPTLLQSTS